MVAPPLLILATGAFATGWLAFRGASFTALWVGGASLAAASVTHSAAQRLMRRICTFVYSAKPRAKVLLDALVLNSTQVYFLSYCFDTY